MRLPCVGLISLSPWERAGVRVFDRRAALAYAATTLTLASRRSRAGFLRMIISTS